MTPGWDDDAVWRALADPTRRALLDLLIKGPRTTGALAAGFPVTRFAVMKHLGILVDAGLIVTERRGRERLNYLNVLPLRAVHERWMAPHIVRAYRADIPYTSDAPHTREDVAAHSSGDAMDPLLNHALSIRSERKRLVAARRAAVYTALLELGAWWPHRLVEGSLVVLEPHVGGRLYEDWDTGGALLGTVIQISEDEYITINGQTGFPGPIVSLWSVVLADADDEQTLVTVRHQAFGDFDPQIKQLYLSDWERLLDALVAYLSESTT